MRLLGRAAALLALPAAALAFDPPNTSARVDGATPIAGPDPALVELGGVAMAEDGSGGVTYRRFEDGRAHVYAARYDGSRWYPPQRVDAGQRFDSAWPRIAAGNGGRLVVIWTQDGPPGQDSLYSAVLPRGTSRFLAPTLVDFTIGEARATHPSIAMAPGGNALLAYRVVTEFAGERLPTGYVRGEIRLARFDGWRWQKLGTPVNRNRLAPQRTPTEANSPKIAITPDGRGAIAWQEPDDQLIDRIWTRRIFDTRTGTVLQASPARIGDRAVGSHADAVALDETALGRVVVAVRQLPDPRDRAAAPRIYVNELPESTDVDALRFVAAGPQPADGAGERATVAPGPPSVALGGRTGLLVGFARGGPTVLGSGEGHEIATVQATAFDQAAPSGGDPPAPALDAGGAGRGTLAYASPAGGGRGVVQQLDGARPILTQPVAGPTGGPVRSIAVAGSGTGDALVAFAQGDADEGQIAVARVHAAPLPFALNPPLDWSRMRRPLVRWDPPQVGFRPRSYTVELDGRAVARTRRNGYRFAEGTLPDGVHRIRVVATNAVGETTSSETRELRLDRRPPTATAVRRGRSIVVTIDDGGTGDTVSGPAPESSTVDWGDSRSSDAVSDSVAHRYRRAGRYRLVVRALDAAGNAQTVRLTVDAPAGRASPSRRRARARRPKRPRGGTRARGPTEKEQR